jgi:hypothetical protein
MGASTIIEDEVAGWPGDVQEVIELFRLNYERISKRRAKAVES